MKFYGCIFLLIGLSLTSSIGAAQSKNLGKSLGEAGSYCTAIRGNGELAPAHWGSLARIVEYYGIPSGMAGGSSASITMFFIESMAMHPHFNEQTQESQRRQEFSYLIKSMQGYAERLAQSKEAKAAVSLATFAKNAELRKALLKVAQSTDWKNLTNQEVLKTLAEAQRIELLDQAIKDVNVLVASETAWSFTNPKFIAYLARAKVVAETIAPNDPYEQEKITMIGNLVGEFKSSVELLGDFDAETDVNLFFREGLINFKGLADKMGFIGDFYSGRFFSSEENKRYGDWLRRCSENSAGKTWSELKTSNNCHEEFSDLLKLFEDKLKVYSENPSQMPQRRIDDKVGSKIASLVSTSVITGKSAEIFKKTSAEYALNPSRPFGEKFKAQFNDIKFGYWGMSTNTQKAQENIKRFNDLKSQKFLSLGETTWRTALSLSPAEPGLSNVQPIPGTNYFSAGGWSDLHPTLVLKAMGCPQVVYVTRRDGETMFGQGVIERLTDLEGLEFSNLTREKNNNGNKDDLESQWSQLYNIANPKSSFSQSISASDVVWCTDWNNVSNKLAFGQVSDLGYNAWVYSKDSSQQYANQITVKDNTIGSAGYPEFAGCIPLSQ